MTDYGKVRSTVKPDEIVIDEFSVWENRNIKAISENVDSENEFVGYEFNMVQYDKNEFILKQTKENSELSEQITQTQVVSFATNAITTASRMKFDPITRSRRQATKTTSSVTPFLQSPFQPAPLSNAPFFVLADL